MNFPEYRQARSLAYDEYYQAIHEAAESLAGALKAADNAFLEDPDGAVKAVPGRGDR